MYVFPTLVVGKLSHNLTRIVFNENGLRCVVNIVATESKALLEIVNFNVEGEQYVCAGTVSFRVTNFPFQQS
jgi:malonyl CoA-acyl carrier protein transacylase